MSDILLRVVDNLGQRLSGPLHLRFLIQPAVVAVLAIADGRADARAGRRPYLLALVTQPGRRHELLKSGAKSAGKVAALALAIDIVFQLWQLKTVYWGEAVIVAALIAVPPYVALRSLTTRFAARRGM